MWRLELYRAYFKCVHPHYPILDRQGFALKYADPTKPPSYLLLQAVLFMAAGHCDVALLHSAGFKSRYEARLTMFKRTKALYDALMTGSGLEPAVKDQGKKE